MPYDQALFLAQLIGAIPFIFPEEDSQCKDQCTFDNILKKHQLKDTALHSIAALARGTDADNHDFTLQVAGLDVIGRRS